MTNTTKCVSIIKMRLRPNDLYRKTELAFGQLDNDSAQYLAKIALHELLGLHVKPKASKSNYNRRHSFDESNDHDAEAYNRTERRQEILRRDLDSYQLDRRGQVKAGELTCPYSGKHLVMPTYYDIARGADVDHVVALSNAWVTGAKNLTRANRNELLNHPLELQLVSKQANTEKASSDASQWLPDNVPYRLQYVARQIAVKNIFHLWVTEPEREAMHRVLKPMAESAILYTELLAGEDKRREQLAAEQAIIEKIRQTR